MRQVSLYSMLALAILLQSSPGAAATHSRTAPLAVVGSVTQNCQLATSPVTFPNIGAGYLHSSSNPAVTVQSSLAVSCTKGATAQVSMNNGLYGSAAGTKFGNRSMKSTIGKAYLGYDLCHDQACSSFWTPTGYPYSSTSDKGSSLPVWGRIKAGQQMDAGTYTDSVTVTVNF